MMGDNQVVVDGLVKRHPVDFLYNKLNWDFIKLLAQIAQYAEGKYGAAEQYREAELTGDGSPMNHMAEHMRAYMAGESHDHFGGQEYQLAAIAYNAMMEYFYFKQRGCPERLFEPRVSDEVRDKGYGKV